MLNKIKRGLVVSCQALESEPLHSSFIMGKMALAAKRGGAVGIRANSKKDIIEISNCVDLPIIGIVKRDYEDSQIYITPTILEVNELLETRCEMIALDATLRKRPNSESLEDLVMHIHKNERLAMADCSTYEEALNAQEIGFDCVSTTLCGYTDYSTKVEGPNFNLLEKLLSNLTIPVIAEGKINSPDDLKKIMELNVHCAVVGGAITRPMEITKRFVEILEK